MQSGLLYCPIPVFRNFSFSRDPFYANGFDLRPQKSEIYRVAPSRLTHFKFEYCAGAIACRGW